MESFEPHQVRWVMSKRHGWPVYRPLIMWWHISPMAGRMPRLGWSILRKFNFLLSFLWSKENNHFSNVSIAGPYISEKRFVHTMRKFAGKIRPINIYALDPQMGMSVDTLRLRREMIMVFQNPFIAKSIKSICTLSGPRGGEIIMRRSAPCNAMETGCQ